MGSLRVELQQLHSREDPLAPIAAPSAEGHLVLVFGSRARFEDPQLHARLRAAYPRAVLAGCSTSGEITPEGVDDDTVTVASLRFAATGVASHRVRIGSMDESRRAGESLARALSRQDLQYLLVLSDGLAVNGSSLVSGIRDTLRSGVPFSGGLAGDAARFEKTLTLDRDGIHEHSVVGVGFYGSALEVRHGSVGGWTPFGPNRTVTRSTANTVYEIDGQRALDVYGAYLGDEARDLPASGLLFPLAVAPDEGQAGLIRTLLAIDRQQGSLTFAGDVPEGTTVRLMHANYDQLVEGAECAAAECLAGGAPDIDFALLISCVGRKLLLGNNTDLEVDAVVGKLGEGICCTGFYSYGEISPAGSTGTCELHNQTMTITTLAEAA
jgi:hypothetical protein